MGEPPLRQTRDLRPLPGGYGQGSGTLARWIQGNLDKEKGAAAILPKKKGRFPAHWGEPPRIQTKDLRVLPGGYGKGSGTLAKWIQKNLDTDAAKAKKEPPKKKAFPAHWGEPPRIQTRDYRKLPGGYGFGSGTLAKWIQENLDADAAKAKTEDGEKGKDDAGKMSIKEAKVELAAKEKELAEIKDFISRARLTREGSKKFQAQIVALENEISALKKQMAEE